MYTQHHRNPPSWQQCNATQEKKKTSERWHLPHAFGCRFGGESNVSETLFSCLPFPRPNYVTVNFPAASEASARAMRLGQIGLMAGLCLPFAVIYSCVYSSCRYPLRSSVPPSSPPPAPPPSGCQRGNTVSLHQVWYAHTPNPCLQLCPK